MEEMQRTQFATKDELYLDFLKSLFIVDYGLITYVYDRKPDGVMNNGIYVDVRTLDAQDLHNVEILFIGNQRQGVDTMPSEGDRVILFGTKKAIASVEGMESQVTASYDETTVKAFPLARIRNALASLLLDNGVFISHAKQRIGIDASGKSIQENERRRLVENPDGSFMEYIGDLEFRNRSPEFANEWLIFDKKDGDDRKILRYKRTDTTGLVEKKGGEITQADVLWADKKWQMEESFIADGTSTKVMKDADGKILGKEERLADGTIRLSMYESSEDGADYLVVFTQNPDGSFSRTQTSDGSAAVNSISVDANGATHLDVANGKAKVDIANSGATTLDVASGKAKIAVDASGAITIDGSASVTLKTGDAGPWIVNSLVVDPMTGIPHGGPGVGIVKLKGA
jgi:hypothetical protein